MIDIKKSKQFKKIKNIHFIGIGGVGMSGIAKIILSLGYKVSGSDEKKSETTKELEKKGIDIKIGHHPKNLNKKINVVVTSSAISPANVEILEAKNRKISIIQRGEMLAEIMRLKTGIAVAGTHGKTTTTTLISSIFYEAKLSPTTIIGGKSFQIDSNAELGKSEFIICETDESDGSFLKTSPVYSVVTNIDLDHMDFYKNEENLLKSFLEFINKTPFYGKTFLCFNNSYLKKLKNKIEKPYTSYGIKNSKDKNGFDIYAHKVNFANFKSEYEVVYYGKKLGKFKLNMPGEHNVKNSLAAIAVALELEIDLKIIKRSLKNFQGVERRMSKVGTWKNLKLIDDYGHHPTEIKATLNTLKKQEKNVICIFQPHRYTRTLEHYKTFAENLTLANKIILTDIYSAGEIPIKGVSSKIIFEQIKQINPKQEVYYVENFLEIKSTLEKINLPKSGVILTLGAGNINNFLKKLISIK